MSSRKKTEEVAVEASNGSVNNEVVTTAAAEDVAASDTVEAPQKTPVEQLIYCGPNLPRGILNRFTVFKGGLPKHLTGYIEKCPAIERLCVPVRDLDKTIQAIQKPGTAESVWFKQVAETDFIKGGVK